MSDWVKVNFSQLFDIIYRYPTYYGIKYVEQGVPEIRGELLTSNGKIVDNYRYITPQDANRFPKVWLKKNDFIMSVRGTVGKVGLANENHANAVITANLLRLSPNPSSVDSLWLLQILLSKYFQSQLENACSQTTIKTIQIPLLCEILIDRPSLIEQKKIAEILTTIDRTIAKTEALIEKYQQIKAGLMHDLFTRGIGSDGKLRPCREEAPELYRESAIGWIPKEWKISPLTMLCSKITDGSHQAVHTTSDGDIPFLFVSCIRNNKILWEQASRIDCKIYMNISKGRKPKEGVILYTAVGSYGNASRLMNSDPISFQRHIAYIAPDETKIDSNYLIYWLNSSFSRRYADLIAVGNAQKTVTLTELSKFPITFPCSHEQRQIYKMLEILDNKIFATEIEFDKLKKQKSGLMHDLLTGKVSVNVDSDAP